MRHYILLCVLTMLTPICALTQLDFTHWLPPMHSRSDAQIEDHYLYLSTPSEAAVTVSITDGSGTLLASPVISAGNPFVYQIATDDPSVMMVRSEDLNTILPNKGIIASADEKFYCNFRARSNLHATSITCKGTAARGLTFRVGAMPQQFDQFMRNFTTGIMATEDNTTVNISDYDTAVEFFDIDGNVTEDELTFVLDSGETFVLSGYNDVPGNLDGFVGALIEADKPIVLNNGNWCGSICTAGGQDIGMDQSVPVNVIGKDYILIRGDGDEQMERPLVIAHHNATAVFVNDVIEPVAFLDAGEYFLMPEMYYTGAGHTNMFIHTSKPTYVYQPLGGSPSRATPGLNFIPPISCAMTKGIDLIPSIDQIGETNYNGAIICVTLAGATVTVNGIPQGGAELVDGAPEWETYKIIGFTGDVVIESTDRMATGMFGFSGDAGFAGFYSGFDQIGFVDFTFEENCDNNPVVFTDETVTFAEEIISWSWDFGDGATSTLPNPTHLYAAGGMYTPYLQVTTNLGCIDTISYPLDLRSAPDAILVTPELCENELTIFTDESDYADGEILTWNWLFNETDTSTLENPEYAFEEYGTYPVFVAVEADNGCVDSVITPITIHPVPTPDFLADDACFYSELAFENLSEVEAGTITTFDWDLGDGTLSELTAPTHLYAEPGTYTVNLAVVSDMGCAADTSIELTRYAAPLAAFTTAAVCEYDTLMLTNSSTIVAPYAIETYNWTLGDGTISELTDPNHNYDEHGVYTISLIALSEEGCVDTTEQEISIHDQPIAHFSAPNLCETETVSFANLSTVLDAEFASYLWSFGDGSTSVGETPNHFYTDEGVYDVNLTVTSEFGCENDTTISIEQFATPVANFTATNGCLYDSVSFENLSEIAAPYAISTYSWSFGDGTTTADLSPTHLYGMDGVFNVQLVTTSENGCVNTITLPLSVYPTPELNATAATVCQNQGTSFLNTSVIPTGSLDSWSWDFGDGASSTLMHPNHAYSSVGDYDVRLIGISNHGCTDTLDLVATVNSLPFAMLTVDDPTICGNECLDLTSISFSPSSTIASHEWWAENGTTGSGETQTFCFDTYGGETSLFDVRLIVTDENGCKDTLTEDDLIEVLPTPEAAFVTDPDEIDILNPRVSFTNLSNYATSYLWSFGDGNSSNLNDPIHIYSDEPQEYEIILFAYNGEGQQCVDTARTRIRILDELIYYVPNAFTPDGDQYNNSFQPVFVSGFDPYDFHLTIYNRWGELLFESFDASQGWSGMYGRDGLVQNGVYLWKIEFKERSTDRMIEDIGHVTLLK